MVIPLEGKATPGPWRVDEKRGQVETADGTLMICQYRTIVSGGDEGEANARLIAAAPDLLAIAEEMLELSDNWPGVAYSHELEERVKAIIKKARGK